MMQGYRIQRRTALKLQLAAALAVTAGGLVTSANAAAADTAGELVVQPVTGVTIDQVNARYGTTTILRFAGSTQALVRTTAVRATLAAMQADTARVAWVESNGAAQQPRAKDDSGADPHAMQALSLNNNDDQVLFRNQWGIARAGIPSAHTITRGAGVLVAVLDTRVDPTHKELAGRIKPEIDVVSSDPKARTASGNQMKDHGTMVAGIILRAAPEAHILPVRVLNDAGFGSVATVAEGIRRAALAGARVLNLSLSTSSHSRVMAEAVTFARQKGAVVVAAYGNEETNSRQVYPADFAGVISVVATDEGDRRAPFSNYGRPALVAAPGVQTVGAYTGNHYAYGDGTSFAAPWVAGQAALLLAKGMGPDAVRTQVIGTADSITSANGGANLGYGRINVYRSLTATATAQIGPSTAPTSVQTAWLQVGDGWDSKSGKTLVQDGKLHLSLVSDNAWLDVEGGQRISFQFGGRIPATASIVEARLYVEHYEEEGISPDAVSFQVGGGALTSPTVFQSRTVPVVQQSAETAVEWDVTQWITTGAKVNDLKLVVRNAATNGRKVKVDRVFLLARYATP